MRAVRLIAVALCVAGATTVATVGSSSAARGAAAGRDPWVKLLARVPASGTFGDAVTINDFKAARAAAGVPRSSGRVKDLLRLEHATGVAPSPLLLAEGPGDPLADELGIRSRDVRRDLAAGDPPDDLVLLEGSIDAIAGNEPSLADNRDLVAVTEALHELGAFAAFLSVIEIAPGAETGGPTPLASYDALAIGPGLADEDEPEMTIVLAYGDATTARNQAARLQAIAEDGTNLGGSAWSDLITVDTVSTKGRLVIGRFRTDRPSLWREVVLRRDSLLATS